jgi:hypothetical protein
VKAAIPAIEQLLNSGHTASTSVFEVLIGPVLYFILNFVWRFVTDPVTHACWAGLTGYFIGLAVTGRYKWYLVAWIGLVAAAVLHGLNDWDRINGQPAWILVSVVSGILFLGYAKVGSRGDPHVPEGWSAFGAHPAHDGQPARQSPGGCINSRDYRAGRLPARRIRRAPRRRATRNTTMPMISRYSRPLTATPTMPSAIATITRSRAKAIIRSSAQCVVQRRP